MSIVFTAYNHSNQTKLHLGKGPWWLLRDDPELLRQSLLSFTGAILEAAGDPRQFETLLQTCVILHEYARGAVVTIHADHALPESYGTLRPDPVDVHPYYTPEDLQLLKSLVGVEQ